MRMYDIIAKKRDGRELSKEEISFFVQGYVQGEIPDYQAAALLMAIYLQGLNRQETSALTMCMANSGEAADLSCLQGIKVDKHSTGGVGDKTTLVTAPIVASLGVKVVKMSGKGLGHTGGTIDKLSAIPGFRTDLSREDFLRIIQKVGLAVSGQTGNLAPADKKIYSLRDATATVESIPLIASSILSKKIAAGADRILLDVKVGNGAFMKTEDQARAISESMVSIGEQVGKKTVALLTNMDQPLGYAVGNSLEVAEACRTLQGKGPEDLTQLSLHLAADMLFLAEKGSLSDCRKMAEQALLDGSAFRTWKDMVREQGGDCSVLEDAGAFEQSKVTDRLIAEKSGFVRAFETETCGTAAVMLGAGRQGEQDEIDYSAGILFRKKIGDRINVGEELAVLFANSQEQCRQAKALLRSAITIGQEECTPPKLILSRISAENL